MDKIELIGFHGTHKHNAERIKRTNFSINRQHIGWLGSGIYFFEEDQDLAHKYATRRHPGKIIKVIRSELQIPEKEIFDCTTELNRFTFHEYRKELKKQFIKKGTSVSVRNGSDFDGKVYDIISREEGYKLIRSYTYTPDEDDIKYGFKESRVPNGIELCLKEARYVQTKHVN